MANIVNNLGQVLVGFRSPVVNQVTSTLLTSLFGVWNGDTTTTTLATGAYGAWNAEGSVTATQLQTSAFGAWNADGTNNVSVAYAWNANGNVSDGKSGVTGSVVISNGTTGTTAATMSYGSGKLGSGAFTFNGSNFIKLPNDTFTFNGDFSVSMWIYLPSAVTSDSRYNSIGVPLLTAFDNQNGYTNYRGWGGLSWYNNQLSFDTGGYSYGGSQVTSISATMSSMNQWVHVVGTRKYGATSSIYINGTLQKQANITYVPQYNNNNLAIIGGSSYAFSNPWFYGTLAGVKIDAVQVWNSVELSQAAVTELYNSGNGQEYPFTTSNALISTPNDSISTNNGTLMNGCLITTSGKIGSAFTFDGVNDYVQLPTDSLNSLTGDFSFSTWAYLTGSIIDNVTHTLLSNSYAPSWYNNPGGFDIQVYNSHFSFNSYDKTNTYGIIDYFDSSSVIIKRNQWQNYTVTKTGTTLNLYIDGSLVKTQTITTVPTYYSTKTKPCLYGMLYDATLRYSGTNGSKLDATTLWTRTLTSSEVSGIYNSGNGNQYPFSSVTAGASNDAVGTNNGTAVGGVSYTTGIIGNAFQFDGTTGYVSLPNNSLNISSDFSVSAWINISALSSSQDIISTYTNSGSNNYGWDLWGANSVLKFSVYNGTTSQVDLTYSGLTTNTWIHVAVTRKVSTGTKMYVNGSLVSSNSSTTNPVYLGTNNADLGAAIYNGSATDFFHGQIDMATVWNKQLTDDEVIQLYNAGSGTQYPFTSPAYLPSVNDSYGSNNGTLMNGCTFTTGLIGKAFTFDGVNDYISLPTNTLKFTGDFSVSLWIYIPADISNNQTIMGCLRQPSGWRGWDINIYSNRIYFEAADATSLKSYAYISSSNIGAWKHVVATFKNGTGGKLYVDNVLRGSFSMTSAIAYDSIDTPTIGAMTYAPNTTWYIQNGTRLDAVSVWNKELTSTEVTTLYNGGAGKQYPNY